MKPEDFGQEGLEGCLPPLIIQAPAEVWGDSGAVRPYLICSTDHNVNPGKEKKVR